MGTQARKSNRVLKSVTVALTGAAVFASSPLGAQAVAGVAGAELPPCQVVPAVEAQVTAGEAALNRIFLGPGDESAKLRAAVGDAQAVLVFPHVAKVGFFVTAARGQGLLSYREADGQWSQPVLVTAEVRSLGPHFSLQTIDMLIVAKTRDALRDLMAGRGAAQPRPGQGGPDAQIVTYSSNMGLTAGISLDEYRIVLDQVANQGLYCRSILSDEFAGPGLKASLKPPPCAQKFAQTLSRASGHAPIIRHY